MNFFHCIFESSKCWDYRYVSPCPIMVHFKNVDIQLFQHHFENTFHLCERSINWICGALFLMLFCFIDWYDCPSAQVILSLLLYFITYIFIVELLVSNAAQTNCHKLSDLKQIFLLTFWRSEI
jgi:hypothetical protein